jgi:guanyl-specific ribonuclease Sa
MSREQALRSLAVLIVCALAAWSLFSGPPPAPAPAPRPAPGPKVVEPERLPPREIPERPAPRKAAGRTSEAPLPPEVASKINAVLDHVDKRGEPMAGYVGGREFQNREGVLPRRDADGDPIRYREWDVNPKISGVNRGPERLVTGSDGSAYFTDDHYRTFIKIRGSP